MLCCNGNDGSNDDQDVGKDYKVYLRRCHEYDPELVRASLVDMLTGLGEPGNLLVPGKTVLLKPNVLGRWSSDAAITTHPEIVGQLSTILIEAGCKVQVGDSSGGMAEANRTLAAFKECGIWKAAVDTGAEVCNFDARGVESKTVRGIVYHLAKAAMTADVVITLPKLKTHGLTMMTGACKNQYGCIPGLGKVRLHRDYPGVEEFSEVLVDICSAVCPDITIMDAVQCMEGNGPAHGQPVQVGALIAGDNPYAVDVVAAELANIPIDQIATIGAAARRGLGPEDISDVVIDGPDVGSFMSRPFKMPMTATVPVTRSRRLIRWLLQRAEMGPVVKHGLCTGCSFCADSCPVDAIDMKNKLPQFDRDTCIDCMCCSEVCPRLAVDVQPISTTSAIMHALANILRRRSS